MWLSETDRDALRTLRANFMAAEKARALYLYGKIRRAITDINDYDPATIAAAWKALTDAEDAYKKAGLTGDFANLRSEINADAVQAGKNLGKALFMAMTKPDATRSSSGSTPSIGFDFALLQQDLDGSVAHSRRVAAVITAAEAEQIVGGLETIRCEAAAD